MTTRGDLLKYLGSVELRPVSKHNLRVIYVGSFTVRLSLLLFDRVMLVG